MRKIFFTGVIGLFLLGSCNSKSEKCHEGHNHEPHNHEQHNHAHKDCNHEHEE